MPRVAGYAYVEILLAVSMLAVCLAPMLEAMAHGVRQQQIQSDYQLTAQRARSRMQALHTEPFTDLRDEALAVADPTVPTGYSDATTVAPRVLVFLSLYDHDNADGDNSAFTGGDPDLVWMRVMTERGDIDYQSLRALL